MAVTLKASLCKTGSMAPVSYAQLMANSYSKSGVMANLSGSCLCMQVCAVVTIVSTIAAVVRAQLHTLCAHMLLLHTRAHANTEEEEAEQMQGQALQEPLPAVAPGAALLHTEDSAASSSYSNSEQQQLQLEDAQIDDGNADTDAAMAATVDLAATASDL
eukprot:19132-Heterococcus_DN1.PRE.1